MTREQLKQHYSGQSKAELIEALTELHTANQSLSKAAAEINKPFNPNGWSIDHSAGRPILVHNNCSVIEAEQAYGLLALIKSAANVGA